MGALVDHGSDGLVVSATTDESPTTTPGEVGHVAGRELRALIDEDEVAARRTS